MRLIGFLVACTILGLALYAWGGRGMWSSLQRKMIFFPTSRLAYTPGDLGLAYEDVRIRTSDGVTLQGWMIPCDGSDMTLLFFHGNAGNIGDRVENVDASMRSAFRCSSWTTGATGCPKEARANRASTRTRRRLTPTSCQGTTSTRNASQSSDGPWAGPSPWISPPGCPAGDSSWRAPSAPPRTWPDTSSPSCPLGRLVTERFDSASKIDQVRAPLLQFHGTQDEIVPYRLGQKLHESAREPKEFVPIPGATHNDTYFVGGRAYFDKIRSFLSEPK